MHHVLYHLFAHSPSSVLSAMHQYRLWLCWEDRSCKSIMDAPILITSGTRATPINLHFSFVDSVTLLSRASASRTGPMIVVNQAESYLAPLETLWPQADYSIGLLNATSWLLIVHARTHAYICVYICKMRDGRVGLIQNLAVLPCTIFHCFCLFTLSIFYL